MAALRTENRLRAFLVKEILRNAWVSEKTRGHARFAGRPPVFSLRRSVTALLLSKSPHSLFPHKPCGKLSAKTKSVIFVFANDYFTSRESRKMVHKFSFELTKENFVRMRALPSARDKIWAHPCQNRAHSPAEALSRKEKKSKMWFWLFRERIPSRVSRKRDAAIRLWILFLLPAT